MSVLSLARPEIRGLLPYSSARMEAGDAEVMLNANESPWPAQSGLNRYPEAQPSQLCARLAALYGVDTRQVLVGRGSDEAIDLLVRAFCRAGEDAIVVCPPTFGMYAVSAAVQGATIVEVPLGADFALDVDALLARITACVKLVFVCTPNNPTGNLVPLHAIERLAIRLSGRALIVTDEAYLEFASAPSAASLLVAHDNLVVLRTLSKAHALAGARIGAMLAHADIVGLLRRILPAYPLPSPSIAAALGALTPEALAATRTRIAATQVWREALAADLRRLPSVVEVLPSAANFLCVRFAESGSVNRHLLRSNIVVRDVSRYPGLAGCLRISIGNDAENDGLLSALRIREAA